MEWVEAADGEGIVFGHVPSSWNPRHSPDEGRLIQWKPALRTEAEEAGKLPAADAEVKLATLPTYPWQERPLPWAAMRSLTGEVGGVVFVALLLALLALRRFRSALLLLALVVVISAGVSWWMIRSDAALMDPEEVYNYADWYGVAAITATLFAVAALGVLIRAIVAKRSPRSAGR
jgi:hypothetical protein